MAVASEATDFTDKNKVLTFDFDPDDADVEDISWQDMRDYGHLTVLFIRTVGTGALDTFKILANSESDGSGTDVEIKAHAVGSEPDAVADHVVLECSAEEIAGAGSNLRYVSAQCEFATSTDEGVVVYIFSKPRHPQRGLTADTIA